MPKTTTLSVRHDHVNDVPVLRLSGDIDLASSDTAAAAISERQRDKPPVLVLDLSRVDFLGACGLTLLVLARRRAAADGGVLLVAGCGRAVLRGLEVTGLLSSVQPFTSVADALAATGTIPAQRTR
jgi:anti-sigma B factor antagonist